MLSGLTVCIPLFTFKCLPVGNTDVFLLKLGKSHFVFSDSFFIDHNPYYTTRLLTTQHPKKKKTEHLPGISALLPLLPYSKYLAHIHHRFLKHLVPDVRADVRRGLAVRAGCVSSSQSAGQRRLRTGAQRKFAQFIRHQCGLDLFRRALCRYGHRQLTRLCLLRFGSYRSGRDAALIRSRAQTAEKPPCICCRRSCSSLSPGYAGKAKAFYVV